MTDTAHPAAPPTLIPVEAFAHVSTFPNAEEYADFLLIPHVMADDFDTIVRIDEYSVEDVGEVLAVKEAMHVNLDSPFFVSPNTYPLETTHI